MITKDLIQELFKAAKLARNNSYSPYSGFKVGSSLLMDSHQIISGCNVENASYGGTVCAERGALFSGIASGYRKIDGIMVVTDSGDNPWPPCGLCRQVLFEFSDVNTKLYLANLNGVVKTSTLFEYCPDFFGPDNLKI